MDRRFAVSRRRSATRRGRRNWRRTLSWAAAGLLALAGAGVLVVDALRALERELAPRGRAAALAPASVPAAPCPVPAPFRDDFASAARRTGVPVPLLVAMAEEESRMDPRARSHAGAEGLLQLMPATARELRLDPRIPRSNVLAGARYLERMLRRFRSLDLALSAYNAGPSGVERTGAALPGTAAYVAAVRSRAAAIASCR